MNSEDRAAYRGRYVERLRAHGTSEVALGWKPGSQQVRFEALASFVRVPEIRSVLDVGCGFGDLSRYLRERGFVGRYVGVDFLAELVLEGQRLYPAEEFRVGDFDEMPFDRTFEFVVASGIFNAKLTGESHRLYAERTLRRMYELSTVAAAADFLTDYVDFRQDDLVYHSPEGWFRFAKGITRRVALRHDYMPFEFAVCLYRSQEFDARTVFSG